MFLRRKASSTSSLVFPSPITEKELTDIKKFWTRVKKEAEISSCTSHDVRHTYASHLASGGLGLNVIGNLLGHSNANTTLRYAHLADQALREATNLFGDKIAKIKNSEKSKGEDKA